MTQQYEFRPDGTYTYTVAQGSMWKLAHEGEWKMRPNQAFKFISDLTISGSPVILVLTPTKILSRPPREGLYLLEKDHLMDNSQHEFFLKCYVSEQGLGCSMDDLVDGPQTGGQEIKRVEPSLQP